MFGPSDRQCTRNGALDRICRRDPYSIQSFRHAGNEGKGNVSQQRDVATSDATRYLCAGAELDEDFSNQIISELFVVRVLRS